MSKKLKGPALIEAIKDAALRHLAEELIAASDDYLPREVRRGIRPETEADRAKAIHRAAAKLEIVTEPVVH